MQSTSCVFLNINLFNWRLITLPYCIGFAIHQPRVYMCWIHHGYTHVPHPEPTPSPPSPNHLGHPNAPSPSILYHASNLNWRSISHDIIHASMQFSQIIPPSPSPSPTESKRLFYTSVSLLLSFIQGYRYHLSKFHIYTLVYCIGVFLSGLLHSV